MISNEVIHFFPEIQTLLKLLMVSSAISCEAERSFSALRRLKTWLRNSMMPRRLNTIIICNIHKDKLDIDEILRGYTNIRFFSNLPEIL